MKIKENQRVEKEKKGLFMHTQSFRPLLRKIIKNSARGGRTQDLRQDKQ